MFRRGIVVAACSLTGCSLIIDTGDLGGTGDGGDLPGIDAAACSEWQPANFDPCMLPDSMGRIDVAGADDWDYDTDLGKLTTDTGQDVPNASTTMFDPPVRILVVDAFTVAAGIELDAKGDLPLLIVSWSTIDLEGGIDVGTRTGDQGEGGSNPTLCDALAATTGASGAAGGGGGGGAFQGAGGDGGMGGTSAGGAGGMTVGPPTTPRGGCNGAPGAKGTGSPVPGGEAGGGLQLSARISINIREGSVLDARGAGGLGGSAENGGGSGGGSGGFIGLDAPTVVNEGKITTNGGGGGEGAVVLGGADGQEGHDGTGPAAGGNTVAFNGGDGGLGGARAQVNGQAGQSSTNGGGGGGGGTGYVIVWGLPPTGGGSISPMPTVLSR